jgi:hypothetical protein
LLPEVKHGTSRELPIERLASNHGRTASALLTHSRQAVSASISIHPVAAVAVSGGSVKLQAQLVKGGQVF